MQRTGIFPRAEWISSTNVYEVNVRQYTTEGTFNAFAKELPRLREMGVETLWFMPVTPIAQMLKKGTMGSPYACSDYTAINPEFGTMEDFRSLVAAAHGLGFKVIIDWVANHTGWDHVWTRSNPDYYKKDESTGNFRAASGMDDIIELDYSNPSLRDAMIAAMRFWVIATGIDGFRCDLASWVKLDFWIEARVVLEHTKNLFWLAELDPVENPEYMQVFDAAYTWKWMHATEDFYKKNEPVNLLKDLLFKYDSASGENAVKLWFTSNHDENSWNGTEYEKYGEAALALAVHSFTWDGIPLVYSGQELPNYDRLPFFDKGPIKWNGTYMMAEFYKTLYSLRKRNNALHAADPAVTTYFPATNTDQQLIVYLRKNGDQKVLVLLNMGKEPVTFSIHDVITNGEYKNVFRPEDVLTISAETTFKMEPWQFFVFENV